MSLSRPGPVLTGRTGLIHIFAIRLLQHAEKHKDSTILVRLCSALPKEAQWPFVSWVHTHSPVRLKYRKNKTTSRLQKRGGAGYQPFNLDQAIATRFLEQVQNESNSKDLEVLFREGPFAKCFDLLGSWSTDVRQPLAVMHFRFLSSEQLFDIYRDCVRSAAAAGKRSDQIDMRRNAIFAEWARRNQEALKDGYFIWPSTKAFAGLSVLGKIPSPDVGMLTAFGYHVGRTNGVRAELRRLILDDIFSGVLPPLNNASYMRQWGGPAQSGRLKKLANTLAALARNEKGRKLELAPSQREADLDYLYGKYYLGHFGFPWVTKKPFRR